MLLNNIFLAAFNLKPTQFKFRICYIFLQKFLKMMSRTLLWVLLFILPNPGVSQTFEETKPLWSMLLQEHNEDAVSVKCFFQRKVSRIV